MNIIKKAYYKYLLKKNPIKLWKLNGLIVGDGVVIYPTANFGSEPYLISIGNHVRINSGVQFITHDGGCWVLRGLKNEYENVDLIRPITVGNNVHIGNNVIVMPGVTIGNNCIIGCGAIVTRDIPDNSVAVGIPARVIENVMDYAIKHNNQFIYTHNMQPDEKRKFLLESINCKNK